MFDEEAVISILAARAEKRMLINLVTSWNNGASVCASVADTGTRSQSQCVYRFTNQMLYFGKISTRYISSSLHG